MPKAMKRDTHASSLMPRLGIYFILAGTLQFIIAMAIAQYFFPCVQYGCYNILTNPISDLGNTATSPLWPLFNYSIILFGIFLFSGLILVWKNFARNRLEGAGMFLLCISALGAAGVGTVAENTILALHAIFALIAFILGGIALLLMGFGMAQEKGLDTYGIYSILSGIIALLACSILLMPDFGILPHFALYGPGIGFGAFERLIAAPVLLWLIVTGFMKLKRL